MGKLFNLFEEAYLYEAAVATGAAPAGGFKDQMKNTQWGALALGGLGAAAATDDLLTHEALDQQNIINHDLQGNISNLQHQVGLDALKLKKLTDAYNSDEAQIKGLQTSLADEIKKYGTTNTALQHANSQITADQKAIAEYKTQLHHSGDVNATQAEKIKELQDQIKQEEAIVKRLQSPNYDPKNPASLFYK